MTTQQPDETPAQRLDRLLNQRRQELRLRWSTVAELAGIRVSTLGAVRRGDNPPSEHTALGLDDALELEPGNVMRILKDGAGLEPLSRPRQTMTTTADDDLAESANMLSTLEAKLARRRGPRTERQKRSIQMLKLAMESLREAIDEENGDRVPDR